MHYKINKYVGLSLLIVVFVFAACTRNRGSEVLAKIDFETISVEEFKDRLNEYDYSFKDVTLEESKQFKNQVLNELIEEKLLLIEAYRKDISVSEEEVNQQIQKITKDYPGKELKEVIESRGLNYVRWKKRMKETLQIQKVLSGLGNSVSPPTDKEVLEYYEKNKAQFKVRKKHLLHQILIKDNALAQRISWDLRDGSKFAELAQKHSIAVEGKHGGKMGWVDITFQPEEVQAIVKRMSEGQMSSIIKSSYGYHLLKLEKIRLDETKGFDEVKGDIRSVLWEEKKSKEISSWKQKAYSKIKVERNYGLFEELG